MTTKIFFKKTGVRVLVSLFVVNCQLSIVHSQSWPPAGMNGNGTSGNPWQITTPAHLEALADYVNIGNGDSTKNKYYKLMNNIDLIGYANWKPIAQSSYFAGNFDGDGKVVQNLTINRPTESNIGLFGFVGSGHIDSAYGSIKNLGVVNCNITGEFSVGGLVGSCHCISITNCFVTGNINGGSATIGMTGGLIGQGSGPFLNISNCYFSGNVNGGISANAVTGGLIGMDNCIPYISNCYATGSVSGANVVGGLIGYMSGGNPLGDPPVGHYPPSIVSNCYAANNVSGGARVGGLVGSMIPMSGHNSHNVIRNSVAANGSVTGTSYAHPRYSLTTINRIVGEVFCPLGSVYVVTPLQNNYALNTMVIVNTSNSSRTITSGLNTEDGLCIPIDSLKSRVFYSRAANWQTAWNIQNPSSIWKICDEQDLPFLRYQGIICNYDITATAGIGGNISPSGTVSVVENTNQTFTFSANTCYEIDSLFIDGKYAPDSIATGSYTFENVTKNHTIEVCFKKIKYGSAFAKTTCENMPYILGNQILTKSGVYYDTLYALNGCDSIVELTLTINPTYFMSDTAIICEDESYNFNGNLLTTSGIYYDTLPTIHGCDSVFRLNLTVNPVPDTTIYFSDNMLIVSGLMGNQYQWYFNGTSIPDATKQVHTYTQNGVYYVIIINRYGCSSKSREIDITDVGVINYELRIKNYVIYPNPTDGKITINNEQLTIKNVEIYDVVGKKQQAECRKQNGEIIMDISHLANGLYFLKVDGKVVKVMKE